MGISISIGISPREPLTEWADFSAEAEQRGVAEMWLIDSQLAMKDVFIGLALTAQRTSSMRIGTGVINLVTRHPTVTANAIAAVAELSHGRAMLGLGAGDSSVYGLGQQPSRLREIEDGTTYFKQVLAGQDGEWRGRTYRLPHQAPTTPVYLAVSQERMCRLAGRVADGAIVMGPAQPDILARQVEWITDGIAAAGRRRDDVRICYITTMSISDDVASAVHDVRSWASAQARLQAEVEHLPQSLQPFSDEIAHAKADYDYREHLSTHAAHQGTISDALVKTLAVAGTADDCLPRIAALADTGVDQLIFPLMGSGRLHRLERLVREVAPILN